MKNLILGAHLLLLTFFGNFNFWTTLFSKMTSNFWRLTQLNARLKNFLNGWLLVLGPKQCLVECATSCVKSEVIVLCNARSSKLFFSSLLQTTRARTRNLQKCFNQQWRSFPYRNCENVQFANQKTVWMFWNPVRKRKTNWPVYQRFLGENFPWRFVCYSNQEKTTFTEHWRNQF